MVSADTLFAAVVWALGNAALTNKPGETDADVASAAGFTPTAVRRRVNGEAVRTPTSVSAAETAALRRLRTTPITTR